MSTLTWSSPVRKSNGLELCPIPNEIYLDILEYIRPPHDATESIFATAKRDLSSLALVCRFFSATTLPWIFENVCFSGSIGTRNTSAASESSFCRSILKGSGTARAMAGYVKKCVFQSWLSDDGDEWFREELIGLYLDALAFMPNIEELTLMETTITRDLLKAIGGLQKLSTLTINLCPCAPNLKHRYFANLLSLRLKSCHFRSAVNDEFVLAINLDTVRHFTLQQKFTHPLFSRSHGPIPLEELDIFWVESISECEALLSRATALKTIRVKHTHKLLDLSKIKQTSSTLPHLTTIEAPLDVAKFLVPGRPVSSITLTNSTRGIIEFMRPCDIDVLVKSTRPITHLGISLYSHRDIPLWKHFPDMRSLEFLIYFDKSYLQVGLDPTTEIKTISSVWPKLPNIQSLAIRFEGPEDLDEYFSLEKQLQWISEDLFPHFPAIRRCSFTGFNRCQWNYSESRVSWIAER
ncbi:hypothetical protein BDN70DRAFT_881421 [Pholiota conissans]|uniref:F-box domain-containing protein n=1 Tax=Pholiota conissans TaxID=109636 RepID=A0A9P5YXX9_9AGAR|nr:hypothetical protein BDN70DRAFT_881421 [Pholiota conissans]